MPSRLNPPPGWPPAPPGWVPPPGWQPDPSWPDPPPGWNLWIEDAAARSKPTLAARWAIAGGAATLLGSLLPFLSSAQPGLYDVNSAPKETAAFFGVVLIALGLAMLVKSSRARIISGILTIICAGLTALTLAIFIIGGAIGVNETDSIEGTVHVNLTPEVGIFVSILGCVAAGIGAVLAFRRR
jgi:hypothetical protein